MKTWPIRISLAWPVCVGHNHLTRIMLSMALSLGGCVGMDGANQGSVVKPRLEVGSRLPDSPLLKSNGSTVRLTDTTGRVKLISIVPTLETLIAGSQTRHLSEALPGLDGVVERVTVSANTGENQESFAKQTNIRNMIFVSDAPQFAFGTATGLWFKEERRLHRAVIVTNRENVIQYYEVIPETQLPNYDRLYQAVRKLAAKP